VGGTVQAFLLGAGNHLAAIIMTSKPKRVTLSFPLVAEAATIPDLRESLIEALRLCMMNELLDHPSLRRILRHLEAARDHLFEAESIAVRAALLSNRDSAART
jgi:hypothetical protein